MLETQSLGLAHRWLLPADAGCQRIGPVDLHSPYVNTRLQQFASTRTEADCDFKHARMPVHELHAKSTVGAKRRQKLCAPGTHNTAHIAQPEWTLPSSFAPIGIQSGESSWRRTCAPEYSQIDGPGVCPGASLPLH